MPGRHNFSRTVSQATLRSQFINYADPNSAYWRIKAEEAGRLAILAIGREEFSRRIDILWPDDEPRTWKETTIINREVLQGEWCEHKNVAIQETGSMRLVNGSLIDDRTQTLICADCGAQVGGTQWDK